MAKHIALPVVKLHPVHAQAKQQFCFIRVEHVFNIKHGVGKLDDMRDVVPSKLYGGCGLADFCRKFCVIYFFANFGRQPIRCLFYAGNALLVGRRIGNLQVFNGKRCVGRAACRRVSCGRQVYADAVKVIVVGCDRALYLQVTIRPFVCRERKIVAGCYVARLDCGGGDSAKRQRAGSA